MRPLRRLHATLRLLLDAVISYRGRGIERLRDLGVGRRFEIARVRGMPRPHTREAVGLLKILDRCGVAAVIRRQGSEQVLHVMAVLVSHDVPLRERAALRAEAPGEFGEE